MDISAFPHPDTHYPHPMEQWPLNVEAPASIVLGVEEDYVDEFPRYTYYVDPQNATLISQTACIITMPNGATLTVYQAGGPDDNNTEKRYEGDWDVYLKGDKEIQGEIEDTAYETLLQAQK